MIEGEPVFGPEADPLAIRAAPTVTGVGVDDALANLQARLDDFGVGQILKDGIWSPTPRLVLAFGDSEKSFQGMTDPLPWPPPVARMAESLAEIAGHPFNYGLVNLYRDGNDFTGWHADKAEFHVPNSAIAVVSLGATRRFSFRMSGNPPGPPEEIRLGHGDTLWMNAASQSLFEHSVPAMHDLQDTRFSLTFRHIL